MSVFGTCYFVFLDFELSVVCKGLSCIVSYNTRTRVKQYLFFVRDFHELFYTSACIIARMNL
jgi:hypothetical protein